MRFSLLLGHSETVADFVSKQIPDCERGFEKCEAIGILDRGALIGGVVYHNYVPEADIIEMSCATVHREWLSKGVLRAIFSYPFDDLECQMVVAQIAENNSRTRRIWRALGATEYPIPRLGGRNRALIISTLTVEDWKDGKFNG